MFVFSVAFFFSILAGTRSLAPRAAFGGGAKAKTNGALGLASTFCGLVVVLIVAATLGEPSKPAFAQRSNLASEGAEREPSRRFDPLRRDALGVQTRYPAVAKIVGRDEAQAREDGSQTIPLYYGTGTFVAELGEWGIVVSNWHVVSEARDSIVAKFPTFSSPARVFLRDKTWDLAALVVRKPPRVAPIPISQEVPDVGEALWVAGYGESAGLTEFQIQGGRVQNYVFLVDDEDEANEDAKGKTNDGEAADAKMAATPENALRYETMAVDKGVRKGDSGGPIFNRYGELAGVLWGSNGESTMGTYCIRVQYFLMQAIKRLADLEAERLLDAPTSDLLTWLPKDCVADAEGTRSWARDALETSVVYPISRQPVYVAADGRETPEILRRAGAEAATKRVRAALLVAENSTATALPPSPPVFSPTFVNRQRWQSCVRPEVAESDFWANLVDSRYGALVARRTAAKVRETSDVSVEADSPADVEASVVAESASNADFADDLLAAVSSGKAKGLGFPSGLSTSGWDGGTSVALRKPSETDGDGDAKRQGSADWENDEETNGAAPTENREDEKESGDVANLNDDEKTNVAGNEAKPKANEKRVKINDFYLNDLQVYLIICAIFCLFYNAARLMTDADLKKERRYKRPRETRAPESRDV